MWWAIASIAMSALSAGAAGNSAAAGAKAQEKWQAYRNAMARIGDAQNQNAITTNTISQIQQSAREAIGIQRAGIEQSGANEVAAAASGTTGRSVRAVGLNLDRAQLRAEATRQQSLQDMFANEKAQRMNSSMAAAMAQDYSYIPKPSSSTAMLGLGGSILKNFGGDIGKWAVNLNFGGGGGANEWGVTPGQFDVSSLGGGGGG